MYADLDLTYWLVLSRAFSCVITICNPKGKTRDTAAHGVRDSWLAPRGPRFEIAYAVGSQRQVKEFNSFPWDLQSYKSVTL